LQLSRLLEIVPFFVSFLIENQKAIEQELALIVGAPNVWKQACIAKGMA